MSLVACSNSCALRAAASTAFGDKSFSDTSCGERPIGPRRGRVRQALTACRAQRYCTLVRRRVTVHGSRSAQRGRVPVLFLPLQ